MPGYVLDGAGVVDLPHQPLAVTVDATTVTVQVQAMTPEGAPEASALYPKPGFLVLPRVTHEIVVAARPGGGAVVFPQGTVLQATIGVDSSRSADPDRAELTPLDVSGLHHVELATIAPAGERLAVTARKTVVDVPLSDLGARARSAARGALGVDRLPEARRLRVEVDIDTTMSMLPLIEDGSVRAAVDVLTGITAVIGIREELQVNLIGRSSRSLPVVELRHVADQVQAQLDAAPLGVGFRSAEIDRSSCTTPTLVFTVTDALPADHAGTGVPGVRRRPVILCADTSDTAAGSGTAVPPAGEMAGTDSAWLSSPEKLFATVTSLVAGLSATPESEGARR
ncbi:hypothetical protein ACFYSW_06305 [Rhodococcus aetherivorans]|uniref:hypothetical protein n=1 Tax=Rhodococcus aetherivorans TaxID=191292 RepID=UPI0036C50FCF